MADWRGAVIADSAGKATLPVRLRGNRPRRVMQVSVEMFAGAASSVSGSASCALRKNGALVTPLIAQGDAAEGWPVEDQPGDELTIEWTGATPGNVCSAYVAYVEDAHA